MTPSARLSAVVDLLETIFGTTGRAEQVVGGYFRTRRYAGSKDRRWVSEFLYTLLRRLGEVDWAIEKVELTQSNRTRAIVASILLDGQAVDDVITNNFQGAHALEIPSDEEVVALNNLTGLDLSEMPDFVQGNFPDWLSDLIKNQYGSRANAIMAAYSTRAPLTFRVNRLKSDRDSVLKQMKDEGIEVRATELSPVGIVVENRQNLSTHSLVTEGILEIQDEAAQVSALLAEAGPGLQIMDYCAGGGGKTLTMGADMSNEGLIYALDIDKRRMRDIASRCKRANLLVVQSHVLATDEGPNPILEQLLDKMDIVFTDVPCSGSGAWRRQPEQRWHLSAERLEELQKMQADILDVAVDYVAPGGKLVYATCSILEAENKDQITEFLKNHTDFKIRKVSDAWSDAGLDGTADGEFLELTPDLYGTDGFFTAILVRDED